MREDLAREFPAAGRAIAVTWARVRGRRPVLWAEPVVWATISGIGAGFIVGAFARAVVALTGEIFQALGGTTPFALFPVVTVAESAAAAVALASGGLIALALELAYVVLGIGLGIPGRMTFCERSGGVFPLPGPDQCTAFGFISSLWPQLVGVGVGIALARAITTRGDGINSLLRIAGGYALALFVVSHVWAATAGQNANPAVTSVLTIAAGTAAAAVAAGVIAGQLPGSIRNAIVVAGISLLPWLTFQVPNAVRVFGATVPPEFVGQMLVAASIQPLAAAFLVLSAAVAARSRFVPREPA